MRTPKNVNTPLLLRCDLEILDIKKAQGWFFFFFLHLSKTLTSCNWAYGGTLWKNKYYRRALNFQTHLLFEKSKRFFNYIYIYIYIKQPSLQTNFRLFQSLVVYNGVRRKDWCSILSLLFVKTITYIDHI